MDHGKEDQTQSPEVVGKLLTTATGFRFSQSHLEEATERIYIIERAFNIRQGITRKHDRIPQRV